MSGINPQFRTLKQFDGDDALPRRVSQLEDNIDRSFRAVAVQALAKLTTTDKKTTDYLAKLWELVTITAAITLTLPVASAENASGLIGVIINGGSATVRPSSGKIQGQASDSINGDGLFLYESDGTGWWRTTVPGATSTTLGLIKLTNDLGGVATAPTVVRLSGAADVVGIGATTLTWDEGLTPSLTQVTRTSDAATHDLTITSQAPNASATGTNRNPGNIVLSVPAPTGAGATGKVSIKLSGTEYGAFGVDANGGFLAVGTNPAQTDRLRVSNNWGISGRNAANSGDIVIVQLTGSDQVLIGSATTATACFLNAKSTGSVQLALGGTGLVILQNSNLQLGNSSILFTATADVTIEFNPFGAATGKVLTLKGNTGTSIGGKTRIMSGPSNATQPGSLTLCLATTPEVEMCQLNSTQRIFALFRGADLTTTEMPANTGDHVMYFGVAATAPTANPVNGFILYMDPGDSKLKARGPSATVTTIANP